MKNGKAERLPPINPLHQPHFTVYYSPSPVPLPCVQEAKAKLYYYLGNENRLVHFPVKNAEDKYPTFDVCRSECKAETYSLNLYKKLINKPEF